MRAPRRVSYGVMGETPVSIRVTEDELAELRGRAAAAGLSVSAYLAAVDGGRAAGEAERLGIGRAALVRLVGAGNAAEAARIIRAVARRAP